MTEPTKMNQFFDATMADLTAEKQTVTVDHVSFFLKKNCSLKILFG